MKIAILTLPLHSNYGGIIQNYALQTVLERMGHEVYTININKPNTKIRLKKIPVLLTKFFVKRILLGRQKDDKKIIEKHIREFINTRIHLTREFLTKKDLIEINNLKFDTIIVGSDQVWRILYAYPDIYTYFLDFIQDKKIKKIAYSASFGTNKLEFSGEQVRKCGELIKEFELITVREDVGVELINQGYKWNCKNLPVQTLDPTMLLSKEDYINISSNYVNKIDGELFYYILDMTEDKKKILERLSKELGYKPFTVMRKSNHWSADSNDKIIPPIELWLQAFNKAKYVFTDSFHGCVFSIIFNKDFIVYGNENRGMSRFNSLLNLFQLNERLIFTSQGYDNQLVINSIDWNHVNEIIKKYKQKSIKLLETHI